MHKTRLLYIEDDPALNRFVTEALIADGRVSVVAALTKISFEECERFASLVDVAIIDQSLGRQNLTGTQVGLALRHFKPDLGIVIFSQHSLTHVTNQLPEKEKMGWSLIQKNSEVTIEELIDASIMSARGYSIEKLQIDENPKKIKPVSSLTPRQIRILDLAGSGYSNKAIAKQIGITEVSVRKDFSNSYSLLGITPSADIDLRTLALLRRIDERNDEE